MPETSNSTERMLREGRHSTLCSQVQITSRAIADGGFLRFQGFKVSRFQGFKVSRFQVSSFRFQVLDFRFSISDFGFQFVPSFWCGVPVVRVISCWRFERARLHSLLKNSRDRPALSFLSFRRRTRRRNLRHRRTLCTQRTWTTDAAVNEKDSTAVRRRNDKTRVCGFRPRRMDRLKRAALAAEGRNLALDLAPQFVRILSGHTRGSPSSCRPSSIPPKPVAVPREYG